MAAREAAGKGFSVILLERRDRVGTPVRCAEFAPRVVGRFLSLTENVISQPIDAMETHVADTPEARTVVNGLMLHRDRFDHALANVCLLALPDPAAAEVELLDATTKVRLLRGPDADGKPARMELAGAEGDLVSLLPQGGPAQGVTTHGLLYPLANEDLPPGPARGLSNVRMASAASVSLRRGTLIVVETRDKAKPARAGDGGVKA